MNDSVLIKTKMVTIGTDIHLLVHATACADFDNRFERKTKSTRFHQTSQANQSLTRQKLDNKAPTKLARGVSKGAADSCFMDKLGPS